jgi:uncharacterized membrane protein
MRGSATWWEHCAATAAVAAQQVAAWWPKELHDQYQISMLKSLCERLYLWRAVRKQQPKLWLPAVVGALLKSPS